MGRHPVMVRQVSPLIPFDLDQSPAVLATAEFVWREDAALELSFSLCSKQSGGSLDGISFRGSKAENPAMRHDNLWMHTCFEAFLARPDSQEYWEMNASPNGDWNLYRFSGYRRGGMAEPQAKQPVVNFSMDGAGCRCTIQISLKPWLELTAIPDIALTMVLEENGGCLSYWALNHPADKPDFHDRRGFLHS